MQFEDKLLIDYNHSRKAMSKFFCQYSELTGVALMDEFKKKAGLWLSLEAWTAVPMWRLRSWRR